VNAETHLFGAKEEDGDKKISRQTVSLSLHDSLLIQRIMDDKNLSASEVINMLMRPTIKHILAQEELIKQNPITVAFDIITR